MIQGGDRYKEYRTVEGRNFEFPTSVTELEHYPKGNPGDDNDGDDTDECWVFGLATELWQSLGTSTHVLHRKSDTSCTLTISYGLTPMGCYGSLYLFLFRRRIAREGLISIRSDLNDILQAATLEQASQSSNNIADNNGIVVTSTQTVSKLPL